MSKPSAEGFNSTVDSLSTSTAMPPSQFRNISIEQAISRLPSELQRCLLDQFATVIPDTIANRPTVIVDRTYRAPPHLGLPSSSSPLDRYGGRPSYLTNQIFEVGIDDLSDWLRFSMPYLANPGAPKQLSTVRVVFEHPYTTDYTDVLFHKGRLSRQLATTVLGFDPMNKETSQGFSYYRDIPDLPALKPLPPGGDLGYLITDGVLELQYYDVFWDELKWVSVQKWQELWDEWENRGQRDWNRWDGSACAAERAWNGDDMESEGDESDPGDYEESELESQCSEAEDLATGYKDAESLEALIAAGDPYIAIGDEHEEYNGSEVYKAYIAAEDKHDD